MADVTGPVRVAETLVLHAADVLRWRDGTSAADPADPATMALLERPLAVRFDDPPPDLRWLHKPGRTALWRRPVQDIVPRLATPAARSRPPADLFALSGLVSDPFDAFQPRRFVINAGAGERLDLVLYPSPQGTRFGSGGGLTGSLRFDLLAVPDPDPALADRFRVAPWALVEVAVTVSAGDVRRFRAQTNAFGDFRLSLWRLPPLPAGTEAYAAALAVRADVLALGSTPIDPDALVAMQVAVVPPPPAGPAPVPAPLDPAAFAPALALNVVPGAVQRIPTAAPHRLALRPP